MTNEHDTWNDLLPQLDVLTAAWCEHNAKWDAVDIEALDSLMQECEPLQDWDTTTPDWDDAMPDWDTTTPDWDTQEWNGWTI